MRAPFRPLAIISLSALAVASKGEAQVKVAFTALAGSYLPATDLLPLRTIPDYGSARVRQRASLALGGRVTGWVTDRLAIEGSFGYSGSGVAQSAYIDEGLCPGLPCYVVASSNAGGSVSMVGARLLFMVGGDPLGTAGYIMGGPAYVRWADRAFSPCAPPATILTCGTTVVGMTGGSPGVVVGIGARSKVTRTALTIRADLEDYLYAARFSGQYGVTPGDPIGWSYSQMQNDLLLSLGLSVAPSGHERAAP